MTNCAVDLINERTAKPGALDIIKVGCLIDLCLCRLVDKDG
ncbi:MAG: hypothetical protein ACYC5F_07095 [Thermoleophilia bacterium]